MGERRQVSAEDFAKFVASPKGPEKLAIIL
jgi:hypothetical protein